MGVAHLLLKAHADVNVATDDNAWSPMSLAAWEGHCEIVPFLLEARAHGRPDCSDPSPLWCACREGHTRILRLLLVARALADGTGVEQDGRTTAKDKTLLWIASRERVMLRWPPC